MTAQALATLLLSLVGSIGGLMAWWNSRDTRKKQEAFELKIWNMLQARKIVRTNGGYP